MVPSISTTEPLARRPMVPDGPAFDLKGIWLSYRDDSAGLFVTMQLSRDEVGVGRLRVHQNQWISWVPFEFHLAGLLGTRPRNADRSQLELHRLRFGAET